jgi:hypothetical protein
MWYRFEYHVDFVGANRVQVHPRVYDAAGTLLFSDADFQQEDYGSAAWNGSRTWTLASYYAAGHSFCVEPRWVNDFGLGNNGQQGASDTRLPWYFAAVQIRTDRWPGPVDSDASMPPVAEFPVSAGLASRYPGDVGMETDPDVVFVDRFEQPTTTDIAARWTDALNARSMRLSSDVPGGSPGRQSLEIPWTGGASEGGHLYTQLAPAVDDRLFVRYYVKYPSTPSYQHAGVWLGGSNPALPWPDPQAGVRPAGHDRFIAAVEPSAATQRIDHYDYWTDMRLSADGRYWGNLLVADPGAQMVPGTWTCVEHMVKLNDADRSNGEHALWVDGVEVSRMAEGVPRGRWSAGIFRQDPGGTPFEGFRWRTNPALRLNWVWLLAYAPGAARGVTSSVKFDHLVVARSYIGCLTPQTR